MSCPGTPRTSRSVLDLMIKPTMLHTVLLCVGVSITRISNYCSRKKFLSTLLYEKRPDFPLITATCRMLSQVLLFVLPKPAYRWIRYQFYSLNLNFSKNFWGAASVVILWRAAKTTWHKFSEVSENSCLLRYWYLSNITCLNDVCIS